MQLFPVTTWQNRHHAQPVLYQNITAPPAKALDTPGDFAGGRELALGFALNTMSHIVFHDTNVFYEIHWIMLTSQLNNSSQEAAHMEGCICFLVHVLLQSTLKARHALSPIVFIITDQYKK